MDLNKSSTDVVNWVGEDAKYVDAANQTFVPDFNNAFVFTWDGVGASGKRTLKCIASSGKIKSYTFNVENFIDTAISVDGVKVVTDYNEGKSTIYNLDGTVTYAYPGSGKKNEYCLRKDGNSIYERRY
ncbi:MAG: hypothetical protein NC131_12105 [Roseburia sp.]|nr:hypothetical protein [Roseburia sp.]